MTSILSENEASKIYKTTSAYTKSMVLLYNKVLQNKYSSRVLIPSNLLSLKVGTTENGSVAIDRHLVRIVVIDVHFYFNLAAILE